MAPELALEVISKFLPPEDGFVVALGNDTAWNIPANKNFIESAPETKRSPVFAHGYRDRPVEIEVL